MATSTKNEHWIKHIVNAPGNITLHHYLDDEGVPISAIYEGDKLISTIERCGEDMMLTHYRKHEMEWSVHDGRRKAKRKDM